MVNKLSFGAANPPLGNDVKFGQCLMQMELRDLKFGGVTSDSETVNSSRFLHPQISKDLRFGKRSKGKNMSESQLSIKYKDVSDW
jgi:hypothetical protein